MSNHITMQQVDKRTGIILQKYPESRDCDKKLIRYYGVEFHGRGRMVTQFLFSDMPSFATIVRCRRLYQNKRNMYQSTAQIEKARREAEQFYRTNM